MRLAWSRSFGLALLPPLCATTGVYWHWLRGDRNWVPVGCLWVLTLIAGTARKAVARAVWCAGLFSRMSGGRGCRSFAFSGHVASGGRPRTFSRFHCRLTNDPYRSLAQLVTKQSPRSCCETASSDAMRATLASSFHRAVSAQTFEPSWPRLVHQPDDCGRSTGHKRECMYLYV